MVCYDATEEVHTALFACVSLDGRLFVDDMEFLAVGGHRKLVDRDDANDGEESACRLPALRAAACMVVEDVAGECNFNLVLGAVAVQLPAREIRVALRYAVVN